MIVCYCVLASLVFWFGFCYFGDSLAFCSIDWLVIAVVCFVLLSCFVVWCLFGMVYYCVKVG